MTNIATLLRGDPRALAEWTRQWSWPRCALYVLLIVLGAGSYGAAIGWWRSPEQALFTAIKCPLVMLFTAGGNALLNGMLAPLLGVNIPFRQSLAAMLVSFVITSAILGSFSPILAFVIWNAPPLATHSVHVTAVYAFLLLGNVALIAFAGSVGNARLYQLLYAFSQQRAGTATRVLLAWLAGNLFLGSQLSWILRPFVGSPDLAVEFLRANAFKGNFYEAVFRTIINACH